MNQRHLIRLKRENTGMQGKVCLMVRNVFGVKVLTVLLNRRSQEDSIPGCLESSRAHVSSPAVPLAGFPSLNICMHGTGIIQIYNHTSECVSQELPDILHMIKEENSTKLSVLIK